MQNGTIFDIKEFAIYDGPGVRQTVFMKGCPLRCAWCHNPEGLKASPELGVSTASCTDCGKCREVCPKRERWNGAYIRSENCTLCGQCLDVCPLGLRHLAGTVYTPEALRDRIMEKAEYYGRYGGGVTFSGGEPLMQAEFLCGVLDLMPETVHTAVETSGYAKEEVFSEVIRRLDYIIMDIKCVSDALHCRYTGVSNERILNNYRILRESGKPHTMRIPLMHGVSDTEENLKESARLLSGDPTLDRVELLPYQKTAGAKYRTFGREYEPKHRFETALHTAPSVFEQYSVRCTVL